MEYVLILTTCFAQYLRFWRKWQWCFLCLFLPCFSVRCCCLIMKRIWILYMVLFCAHTRSFKSILWRWKVHLRLLTKVSHAHLFTCCNTQRIKTKLLRLTIYSAKAIYATILPSPTLIVFFWLLTHILIGKLNKITCNVLKYLGIMRWMYLSCHLQVQLSYFAGITTIDISVCLHLNYKLLSQCTSLIISHFQTTEIMMLCG